MESCCDGAPGGMFPALSTAGHVSKYLTKLFGSEPLRDRAVAALRFVPRVLSVPERNAMTRVTMCHFWQQGRDGAGGSRDTGRTRHRPG